MNMIRFGGCAALVLSACVVDPEDPGEVEMEIAQSPIIAGFNPPATDALANVTVELYGGGCSGTLLRNRWVLTAAHCVGKTGGSSIIGDICDRNGVCRDGYFTYRHPNAMPWTSSTTDDESGLMDVALVRLDGDLGPAGLVTDISSVDPFVGWGITCYGYGRTTLAPSSAGTLKYAALAVTSESGDRYQIAPNTANQVPYLGDSGGPCFRNGVLVGVNSQTTGTPGNAVQVKANRARQWALDIIAAWDSPRDGSNTTISGVSRTPERVDVFWPTPSNAIMTNEYEESDGGFLWDTGAFYVAPASNAKSDSTVASVSRYSNRLDVFYVGPDRAIGSTAWEGGVNNNAWAAPFPVTPPNYARSVKPSVSAVSRTDNRIDVFYTANAGALQRTTWEDGVNGNSWTGPLYVTGSLRADSPVAALARTTSNIDVFFVSPDGGIGSVYQVNGGGFSGPGPITGPNVTRAGTTIAPISRGYGFIDMFWVGPDGSIKYVAWTGSWSPVYTLTGPYAARGDSPIAAVSRHPERMDVFWIGPDGRIGSVAWEWGVNNGLWSGAFPVSPTDRLAAAGSGLSAVSRHKERVEVFYAHGSSPTTKQMTQVGWTWNGTASTPWSAAFAISAPGTVR